MSADERDPDATELSRGRSPTGVRERLLEALLDALAIAFPIDCAGCGAADRSVCGACSRALIPAARVTTLAGGFEVTSALEYDGKIRSMILAFKEQGRTDVTRPLARALAVAVRAAVRGEVELAIVPSSRRAYRRRGYDPVRILVASGGLERPSRVLTPGRRTARQKTLGREARGANMLGSMVARGRLDGRRFLLVDDVLTTGATLTEAARAIRDAGGMVVSAATLAFTPKRIGDPPAS